MTKRSYLTRNAQGVIVPTAGDPATYLIYGADGVLKAGTQVSASADPGALRWDFTTGSLSARELPVGTTFPSQENVGLTNNGNAFVLTWAPSSSLRYVVYSAYAPTGRQWVPISPWITGTTFTDGNVYDGRHIWYQVWRVVDGVEVLHAEFNGIQPARVWENATSLPPGRYENRFFRSLSHTTPDVLLTNGQSGSQLYDFERCAFAGMQYGLKGFGNRVKLRNSRFWRLHPGGPDRLHGNSLHLESFRHADVQNCYFENQFSCYFTEKDNRGAAGDTLTYSHNFIRNVMNQRTDANGGYKTGATDFERGQAIQISKCSEGLLSSDGSPKTTTTGIPGGRVCWNYVHNEPGYSRVEDNISCFKLKGAAGNLFQIDDNLIDGAHTYVPGVHTGYSGGGIMIGDEGGSFISQSRNIVLRYGNYGIAIMNGEGNQANDNRMTRGPRTWDGIRIALAPPTGLIAAQFWDYNGVGAAMKNNSMNGNLLRNQYEKADGTKVTNHDFVTVAGQSGNTYTNNIKYVGDVTMAMENAEQALWRDRLQAANKTFGPQWA